MISMIRIPMKQPVYWKVRPVFFAWLKCSFVKIVQQTTASTPPKFNIAPEKWWLEDEFPVGALPIFRGRTVKSPGCMSTDWGCGDHNCHCSWSLLMPQRLPLWLCVYLMLHDMETHDDGSDYPAIDVKINLHIYVAWHFFAIVFIVRNHCNNFKMMGI